ncbi:hypothetical protein D3C72_2057460 [compost metagenome]
MVLTVFDVELEHQVQARSGRGVELGLHGIDDVCNAHDVFLCFQGFLAPLRVQ